MEFGIPEENRARITTQSFLPDPTFAQLSQALTNLDLSQSNAPNNSRRPQVPDTLRKKYAKDPLAHYKYIDVQQGTWPPVTFTTIRIQPESMILTKLPVEIIEKILYYALIQDLDEDGTGRWAPRVKVPIPHYLLYTIEHHLAPLLVCKLFLALGARAYYSNNLFDFRFGYKGALKFLQRIGQFRRQYISHISICEKPYTPRIMDDDSDESDSAFGQGDGDNDGDLDGDEEDEEGDGETNEQTDDVDDGDEKTPKQTDDDDDEDTYEKTDADARKLYILLQQLPIKTLEIWAKEMLVYEDEDCSCGGRFSHLTYTAVWPAEKTESGAEERRDIEIKDLQEELPGFSILQFLRGLKDVYVGDVERRFHLDNLPVESLEGLLPPNDNFAKKLVRSVTQPKPKVESEEFQGFGTTATPKKSLTPAPAPGSGPTRRPTAVAGPSKGRYNLRPRRH